MAFMRRLKGRAPPEGWELLESTIEDFESQMRDAVAEDHDGKRKNETTWRVHRIHFEKNRFIYDLMYKQKALSKDLVRVNLCLGGRRARGVGVVCSVLPRASHATSVLPCLTRPLPRVCPTTTTSVFPSLVQYDYLVREKVADGALIAKWRKPGYENLCSMLAIQKGGTNFGTASICRVPIGSRAGHQVMTPDVKIGCISCASGDGVNGGPIWWNTTVTAADLEKKKHGGGGGKKRPAEDDEIDEEVKKRLAALQGSVHAGLD